MCTETDTDIFFPIGLSLIMFPTFGDQDSKDCAHMACTHTHPRGHMHTHSLPMHLQLRNVYEGEELSAGF